ncbi:MAG: aminotransferase class III-fold pyridoxal phosphate-dependent enzyme [Desulfobacterales bacterium]|nr:aminotransferase class III-fold pyridoxal phosphate-dependent enzyme [Desulfobacterales bacterium]MBF0397370.1 aminotransferase class III-fold pyridoxal phosphate-dependent enzyme [Desulfobacterales bacterium]
MNTYTYEKSQSLFKRAAKVIPCGIYGHLSPAPLVPPTDYPFYAAKASGSKFWDVDGNEFIDYMCAYGPMVLGYNNPIVEEAAEKQRKLGNCITSPSPVMVDLAEYLVNLISIADWAFFAKNGGDATSFALMIARAATGRAKAILIKGGYHGVSPWAQGPGHHGVTDEDVKNNIYVKWNDISQIEEAISDNPKQIAAFMATPYHHPAFTDSEMPGDGYWQKVEQICKKEGIVLIVDDVRCGFRLDMRGSNEYFGFKPDLICYCKAIGNGYPISALVGKDYLRNYAAKVFYTGSYWFSAVPMAAALTTLKELERINGPDIMIKLGKKLTDGMTEIAKTYGYNLKVTGVPSMPSIYITDDESLMLHQDFCAACTKRGAFFTSHHNWFISTAHTDEDIQRTWDIVEDAFKAIKKK